MIRKTKPFARTVRAFAAAIAFACAAGSAQAAGFASPSGNITCYVDVYSSVRASEAPLVCLIFDAEWDLPPNYGDGDPTCDLDRTRTLILPPEGRPTDRWTCHGDVFWPAPLGRISYGSDWSLMGFTCKMAERGVTCTNGDRTMFISRASRAFF